MNFRWATISHNEYIFIYITFNTFTNWWFWQQGNYIPSIWNLDIWWIQLFHFNSNNLITMELSSKDFAAEAKWLKYFFFQKVHCFKSVWKSFSSLVIIRSIDQAFEINRSPLKICMPIVQNSMSEALNFAYISPDITHAVGTNIELPSVKEKLTLDTISLEIL